MFKSKKVGHLLVAIMLGLFVMQRIQAVVVHSDSELQEGDLVTIGSKATGKLLSFGAEQPNWVAFHGDRADINSIFRISRVGKNIVFQCLANSMNLQSVPAQTPKCAWVIRAENKDKGAWEEWTFIDGKYLLNMETGGNLNNRDGYARTHGTPTVEKKGIGKKATTQNVYKPAGKIPTAEIEINKITSEFQPAASLDELAEGRVIAIKFLKTDKFAQLGGDQLPTWLSAKSTNPAMMTSLFRIRRQGAFIGLQCLANGNNVQSVPPESLTNNATITGVVGATIVAGTVVDPIGIARMALAGAEIATYLLAHPDWIVRAENTHFSPWEEWTAEFDAQTAFLQSNITKGYLTLHYQHNDLVRTHGAAIGLLRWEAAKKDDQGASLQILVFGGAGTGSIGFRTYVPVPQPPVASEPPVDVQSPVVIDQPVVMDQPVPVDQTVIQQPPVVVDQAAEAQALADKQAPELKDKQEQENQATEDQAGKDKEAQGLQDREQALEAKEKAFEAKEKAFEKRVQAFEAKSKKNMKKAVKEPVRRPVKKAMPKKRDDQSDQPMSKKVIKHPIKKADQVAAAEDTTGA